MRLHNVDYAFGAELNDLTWSEIGTMARNNSLQKAFSIGDYKNISVPFIEWDNSSDNENVSGNYTLRMIFAGYSNTEATFVTGSVVGWFREHGWITSVMSDVNNIFPTYYPSDFVSVLKTKNIKTNQWISEDQMSPNENINQFKFWFMSETELGLTPTYESANGTHLPYFSSNSRRTMTSLNGSQYYREYYTRSLGVQPEAWNEVSVPIIINENGRAEVFRNQGYYRSGVVFACVVG